MSITIRLTDLSLPQAWILADASPNNDGVMTALQAAQLAALIAGGGGGGPWVQIPYIVENGFVNSAEGLPAGVARLVGKQVQFAGAIQVPDAGATPNLPIAVMPASQIPSVPRLISVLWKLGNTMGEANLIVDNGTIFVPPFPPGILAVGSQALPAAGGGNHTQLLIEGLSYFLDSTPGT